MRITWTSTTARAPASLARKLEIDDGSPPRCVFAFASSTVDLDALGQELSATGASVVACTTAGQIGRSGFEQGGVTAAAIFDELTIRSFTIDLRHIEEDAGRIAEAVRAERLLDAGAAVFGVVLVDGLAGVEERLMAALHSRMPRLPLVGGSAGDERRFHQTFVWVDGAFRSGVAALHVITTPRRVAPIKVQHHLASDRRLVITRATSATRTIHEVDGVPAAEAYAAAIGVTPAAIDETVMAAHPLILKVDANHYVRSVRSVEPDGSLQMFCAIEQGLVVRLGATRGIRQSLEECFAQAIAIVGRPVFVLGFDCILRRLEIEREGLGGEVGAFFSTLPLIGFSTYGEQFNGVHANQTFTGFVVGDVT